MWALGIDGSWDGGELTVSRDEVEMRLLGYKRRLGCPELVEQPAARGFEHFSRIAKMGFVGVVDVMEEIPLWFRTRADKTSAFGGNR